MEHWKYYNNMSVYTFWIKQYNLLNDLSPLNVRQEEHQFVRTPYFQKQWEMFPCYEEPQEQQLLIYKLYYIAMSWSCCNYNNYNRKSKIINLLFINLSGYFQSVLSTSIRGGFVWKIE